jgi:uncharacterized protein (DUF849 family)
VLIQACLNGGTTRVEHSAVPFTPAELAADARAAKLAGAGAVHVHPRDSSGAQTLWPRDVLPAVAAVRAATGLPVGVTTAIWAVDGDTGRRMSLVAGWTGANRPDFASINMNEPGTDSLADLLTRLGIEIEAGVWTAEDARRLAASTFASRVIRVLLEPVERSSAAAVATAAESVAELTRLGITAPRMHHGYGVATWDVLRAAVAMGENIRIGLEDTTVLPDGTSAAGNAELVAAAARLAREAE